jgi:hypothetical protein
MCGRSCLYLMGMSLIAGLALVGMYGYYTVTNEWGLFHV